MKKLAADCVDKKPHNYCVVTKWQFTTAIQNARAPLTEAVAAVEVMCAQCGDRQACE